MKVLVACEYTGTVRDAFLRRGHDAWSCDLLKSPLDKGPHIQRNVLELDLASYDLVIGHPPCTYLTLVRVAHGYPPAETSNGFNLFMSLLYCGAPRVCIENPLNIVPRLGGPKQSQIVEPYQFGDDYRKRTCLWLIGLPRLKPTKIVKPTRILVGEWGRNRNHGFMGMDVGPMSGHLHSIFSHGMAEAMADQWGSLPKIEARWPRVHRDVWAFEALA